MRFRLNNTLHAASVANADDVLTMKGALQSLGEYETPTYGMTPYPDTQMFDGIKRVQKKNGLTVDGMARPGGPTETTLNASLAKKEMEKRNATRPATPARQTAPHTTGKFGIGDAVKRVGKHQNQEAQPPQPTAPAASQALQLRAGVGRNQANQSKDVIALKNALSWTGHYPLEKAHRADPNVDEDLTWGISGFQRDFGLKQDGYSRPGGETEARLNQLIVPLTALKQEESKQGKEGQQQERSSNCSEIFSQITRKRNSLDRKLRVQENYDKLLQEAREHYRKSQENLENVINDFLEDGQVFSQVCNWVPHRLGEVACRVAFDGIPIADAKRRVNSAAKVVEARFKAASEHAETITERIEEIEKLEADYAQCLGGDNKDG